ncbi:MAG: thiamine phosphate synthase [Chloroflexota bacterium]
MAAGSHPQLHLVVGLTLRETTGALLAIIRSAAENGVDWVQVRDHQAAARDLYELARAVVGICRPLGVRVAVNDRLDVALAAGVDAVQLSARSLPIAVARELDHPGSGRPALQIGASVHDLDAARRAVAAGADWLTFGHVYPTASHPGEPPRGLGALTEVAVAVGAPVIAIGGIDRSNVDDVPRTGAAGVAVISAILGAPDPGAATAELRRALDRSSGRMAGVLPESRPT